MSAAASSVILSLACCLEYENQCSIVYFLKSPSFSFRSTAVNTVSLNVVKIGAPSPGRTPVVLLHGWRHNLWALKPLGELLAPYTEVHLVDLPGYGESSVPDESWGTREYAERIVQYLDEQGLKQVDLVGHSFGGKIGAVLSSSHPDRIRKLVLMNASALRPLRTGREKFRFAAILRIGKILKFIQNTFGIRWYHDYFIPKFASADYKTSDGALRRVFVRIVNEDFSEEMKKVQADTLLLWGDQDTETRINIAERLLKILPKAKLVTLFGKGHEPFSEAGFHLCAYYIAPFFGIGGKPNTEPARAAASQGASPLNGKM